MPFQPCLKCLLDKHTEGGSKPFRDSSGKKNRDGHLLSGHCMPRTVAPMHVSFLLIFTPDDRM